MKLWIALTEIVDNVKAEDGGGEEGGGEDGGGEEGGGEAGI